MEQSKAAKPRRFLIDSFKENPKMAIWALVMCFLFIPAGFSVISFVVAETPEQVNTEAGRIVMDPDWSAGVMNHGEYYEWWTISDRPVLFLASVLILILAMATFVGALVSDLDAKTIKPAEHLKE